MRVLCFDSPAKGTERGKSPSLASFRAFCYVRFLFLPDIVDGWRFCFGRPGLVHGPLFGIFKFCK